MKNKQSVFKRRGVKPALILATSVSSLVPAEALALSWELKSGTTVDLDTTVTYDAQWSVEGNDPTLLNAGGNDLLASLSDDGNRNFDSGDMTQNRIGIGTDLDINYGDGGFFARARGWYDERYNDESLYEGKPFQKDGIDETRSDVELLDAFAYHVFYVNDQPWSVRVGKQVVSWGESLFLGGGISSAQGPLDATKANAPGTELKDIFLPLGQAYTEIALSDAFSVGAYYQWDWEPTRIDAPGSNFSILDVVGIQSDGDLADTSEFIGVDAPVTKDEPDEGQFGVALRYLAESLNSTEFGLYYLNYNDFFPALQFDLAPAFSGQPDDVRVIQEHFEDIDLYGFSFGTVVGGTNISGEVSYRDGQPVQVAYPAGFKFEKAETLQAQVSVLHVFGSNPIADLLQFRGEVGYNRILDLEERTGDITSQLDNDRNAAGAVLSLKGNYFNVAPALDMAHTLTYRQDFNGVSSVPFTFTEGVEQLSWKTSFTYLNNHSFGASYVWYITDPNQILKERGNLELGHLNADRDYLAAFYKYRF